MKTDKDGWTKRFKGSAERGGAWIFTHPDAIDGRAIVQNQYGVSFNGEQFASLEMAKIAALSPKVAA